MRPQRCLSMEPMTCWMRIGAGEIGVDDGVPVGALHAHDQLVAGDAGVVDQDIDLAEVRKSGLDCGFHVVFGCDIHLESGGVAACGFDLFDHGGEFFFIARAERDGVSGFSEGDGAGTSDALRCAGDEGGALRVWHAEMIVEDVVGYRLSVFCGLQQSRKPLTRSLDLC